MPRHNVPARVDLFRWRSTLQLVLQLFLCVAGWLSVGPTRITDRSASAQTPSPSPSEQFPTTTSAGRTDAAQVQAGSDTKNGDGKDALELTIIASLEKVTTSAIEKAERSVVAITRVRKDRMPAVRAEQLLVPGQRPFADAPENPDFIPSDFASGVLVSDDGLIVTCAHALDDPRRNDYYVWLDRRVYTANVVARPAQVLASDPYTDLAILKIETAGLAPTGLVPIAYGNASQLRKGSFVISLGNPYATARDGQASASWGIVANLGRTAAPRPSSEQTLLAKESQHQFGTLIQTDARLNLGTSGGALVNLRGEMVGLTTSLAALSGFEQSAGYAIAVDDMFKRVVDALKTGHQPEFGFLGIQPEDLRAHERAAGLSGARVTLVLPGMPGDQAGLRNDDCIVEVNSKAIEDRNGLFRELSQLPAGAQIDLAVQRPRRGETSYTPIQLKATLSKKYISTSRPAYALHAPQQWRGMLVEYVTAVPSELVRGGPVSHRRPGAKLAILSVEPDSAAWRAGVRAGHTILSINGNRVATPDEFYAQAKQIEGIAQLQLYRSSERLETISLEP